MRDGLRARAKLQKANVIVTLGANPGGEGQMRVSCSVFNNQADIDRLIEALA